MTLRKLAESFGSVIGTPFGVVRRMLPEEMQPAFKNSLQNGLIRVYAFTANHLIPEEARQKLLEATIHGLDDASEGATPDFQNEMESFKARLRASVTTPESFGR